MRRPSFLSFRSTASALLLAVVVLAVPGTSGEAPGADVGPTLPAQPPMGNTTIEVVPWEAPPRVAIEPAWTDIPTPWRVTFGNVVTSTEAPADGKATLTWTLDCGEHQLRLGNATTPVQAQPVQGRVEGVAGLQVQAAAGTRGMEDLPCLLKATFHDSAGMADAETEVAVAPVVDFVDGLEVTGPEGVVRAGPQKQVGFPIGLANHGNSRVEVRFETLERPGGKWIEIRPEPWVLAPGADPTAIVTVATPFHNGYVSSDGTFRVRVTSSAASDPSAQGAPHDIELHASARGWYVPGPSLLLALGAVGLAAAVLRRRR